MCIYGYCRISRPSQNIERQIRNIKAIYPAAVIIQEAYSGRYMDRPQWLKLYNSLKNGDTVIFDSVSRMSRCADDGFTIYRNLYKKGVNLVFLKERHIDTTSYTEAMKNAINIDIKSGDTATDELVNSIMAAINNFMMNKVEQDIMRAFEQAEKEVQDLRQRTSEGIATARINGKQIGQRKGNTLNIRKSEPIKKIIMEKSKDFKGTNTDAEVMAILDKTTIKISDKKEVSAHLSRNTYYKYKRELAEALSEQEQKK